MPGGGVKTRQQTVDKDTTSLLYGNTAATDTPRYGLGCRVDLLLLFHGIPICILVVYVQDPAVSCLTQLYYTRREAFLIRAPGTLQKYRSAYSSPFVSLPNTPQSCSRL